LTLLIHNVLLDVQLLQGSIVCALEQPRALGGVRVTGIGFLFYDDVQLIGYDFEWRSILETDEERWNIDQGQRGGERRDYLLILRLEYEEALGQCRLTDVGICGNQ
jgi:hypothetical protein